MEMIYDHVKLGFWWATKDLGTQIVSRKYTHLGSIIEIYLMLLCSLVEQTLPSLMKIKIKIIFLIAPFKNSSYFLGQLFSTYSKITFIVSLSFKS